MALFRSEYLGDLQVTCTNTLSGASITTDAFLGYQNKGDLLNPIDLCVASLCCCSLSMVGTYADNHEIDIDGAYSECDYEVAVNPKRITKIKLTFVMPKDKEYSDKEKMMLEKVAVSCGVHHSLNHDIEQEFNFVWN